MPIYEYICDHCHNEVEALQKISEDPLENCPLCGAKQSLHKKTSIAAFHLKGGGWYKDGYSSGPNGEKSDTIQPGNTSSPTPPSAGTTTETTPASNNSASSKTETASTASPT